LSDGSRKNRVSGTGLKAVFGTGKVHDELDRVRYSINGGSEIWVRAGILAMNLKSAANQALFRQKKRIEMMKFRRESYKKKNITAFFSGPKIRINP